jgi:hypothetical protein
MVKLLLLLVTLPLVASCTSSKVTLNPRGTTAMISLWNGTTRRAELLALQNGSLVTLTDSVWTIPEADIRSVELDIDQERGGWIVLTAITQALPTGILLAIDDAGSREAGLIGLAVTTGTVISYLASEPQDDYRWPLPPDQAETFRSYLCYPYGITPGQLKQLRATFPSAR